jgi:hypothetical protein
LCDEASWFCGFLDRSVENRGFFGGTL